MSKLPTQTWNKAKISPRISLKTALSERENHSPNDGFWLVESRDAHRLLVNLNRWLVKNSTESTSRQFGGWKKVTTWVIEWHSSAPKSPWHGYVIHEPKFSVVWRYLHRSVLAKNSELYITNVAATTFIQNNFFDGRSSRARLFYLLQQLQVQRGSVYSKKSHLWPHILHR